MKEKMSKKEKKWRKTGLTIKKDVDPIKMFHRWLREKTKTK